MTRSPYPTPPPLPAIIRRAEYTAGAFRALRKERKLERVERGTYAAPTEGPPWVVERHRALAAIAAIRAEFGPEVVFSHSSSARIFGLWDGPWDGLTHVTGGPGVRQRTGLRRHIRALSDEDVVEINGIRATNLPRTIIDCGLALAPRWALSVADSGLRSYVLPRRDERDAALVRQERARDRLRELVERSARCPGVERLTAVVDAADSLVQSPPESFVRWTVLAHGLTKPITQYLIRAGGQTSYADLGWEFPGRGPRGGSLRLAEEYDGEDKYFVTAPGANPLDPVLQERNRERLILAEGVDLARRDKRDLADPHLLYLKIAARLPADVVAKARPVPALLEPGCCR